MREITLDDVEDLALGAVVLGTGGGGEPYVPTLMVREALRTHGPVPVVHPDELDPEGLVLPLGIIGAPTAAAEKLFNGGESRAALRALENCLGRKGVAVMPIEVGGGATLLPIAAAAELGLPVVDADSMRRAFPKDELTLREVDAVAVTGVTSPVNPGHEQEAARIIVGELGDAVTVTQGHEVGGIGLLERENSAILNSALLGVGRAVVGGLTQAVTAHGLDPDLYLTQNDGTLLSAEEATRRPVLTIGSGPTNSMRGAAYLSGLADAVVMDVGGTSTDVGLLVGGFPRESALAVDIGGVRTNYRMPDLISVGLGGGTKVCPGDAGKPTIGPDSVGYRLTTDALVFGGDTLTLSDISVLSGRVHLGEQDLANSVDRGLVRAALAEVDERINSLADRIKASRGDLPLIAVGGGAHLVPELIDGISKVVRHEHAAVANAIGAAIADASGSIDRTFSYDEQGREGSLKSAKELARDEAVRAGADPASVRITRVVEIPMSYMPGNCARVQVKAVGPLLQHR